MNVAWTSMHPSDVATVSVWQIISGSDNVFAMHGSEITENSCPSGPKSFPVICLMKGNASTCMETQFR